mgnify:CR=1 FL=1
MIIGLDIDGVIYQTESLYRDYSEKYNKLIGGKNIKDDELKVENRYDWSDEQVKSFIDTTYEVIELTAPLYANARDVLARLKQNHKIVFITSRGLCGDKEVEITKQRFQKDNIPFDKIIFSQRSKVRACKELNIDIMIDDNSHVLDELYISGVNCLYFRDLRNKSCDNTIVEVYSWQEIEKCINELTKVERIM